MWVKQKLQMHKLITSQINHHVRLLVRMTQAYCEKLYNDMQK